MLKKRTKMEINYDYSKFDFNKPITREQIDLEIYNNKFAYVDLYKSLKAPSKDMLATIWNDVTMFAYMFLRLDGRALKLYPYQDIILNDPYRFKYFEAANQIGKLLDDKTLIPTPNGFKENDELVVGDVVFGSDGKPTKVTSVFHHKNWALFKITFNDGSTIKAGGEHLWKSKSAKERFVKTYTKGSKTWDNPSYNKWNIYNTNQILKKGKYTPEAKPYSRFSIPVTDLVEYTEKQYNVSPYLLGLLLGDGSLVRSATFTTGDDFIAKEILKTNTFNFVKKNNKIQGTVSKITPDIRKLGLLGTKSDTKFIPRKYMYGSVNQRKELLKGLMDTDGSVYGKCATLEYCTVSKRLKDDFVELVNSLGGIINKVSEKNPFYYDKDRNKVFGKLAYSIRFKVLFNPFKLPRKTKLWKPVVAHKHEKIIMKIEEAGFADSTCIMVDNKDKTYLATKDYIVTHNSISLDVQSVFDFTHDNDLGFNTAIVSKSLPQATHQMRRIKSLLNSTMFSWKDNKGEADNMSVISLDILGDKGNVIYTNYLIVAPSSEGLLGYDLHDLNLDEFEFWDNDTRYFFEQIAEPRTYHTKGNVTIFSNPNGADSYGAELTKVMLPNGKHKFHVYNFNFLDKPGNVQEDLDMAAAGKERQVVESTLLAVRSISDRNYFTTDEIHKSYDPKLNESSILGKQPFCFLDVGAKHDQSVFVAGYIEPDDTKTYPDGRPFIHLYVPIIHAYPVGYPLSRVVGAPADDDDGWHYEKSVKEHLEELSVNGIQPVFGVDVTGNSGITPLFNGIGIVPVDVVFSGPVKSGMYQRFKYYMEKGLLHRAKSKAFEYEMAHMEMKKSARGYLMVHHASEKDLDDIPDSFAGLIHLSDNPDYVPVNFEMI